MSPLVLDYRDANHGVIHYPKEDQVGKSLHQRPSRIPTDTHPTGWDGRNPQNLPLKIVDEIVTQILGSFVVEIPDFSKFGLNSGVVFNPHCLKRRIKS
jgi:hypothetical protein